MIFLQKTIWKDETSEYRLESLTKEAVACAEQLFQVKLPHSYLRILQEQNGGNLVYNAFPALQEDFFIEPYIEVDYIYGIGEANGILETDDYLQEWDMPKGLILFHGDGHTWLAFDYRQVSSKPPIVYIDNESEQMIKIADDFEEFLNGLYKEDNTINEEDIQRIEDSECSKEDFENFIEQNNMEKLYYAISEIAQSEMEFKWMGERFLQLANYPDSEIRKKVANNIWNFCMDKFEDNILQSFIQIFQKDADGDVRMYGEMILEKMNYSFADLTRDLHTYEYVSINFIHQGSYYQLNQAAGKSELRKNETDAVQAFRTAEELLEQAKLNEKPLKEEWSAVKVI